VSLRSLQVERAMTLEVSNEELFTVRDAMRELNQIVAKLQTGELAQAVLMKGSKMVARIEAVR
jgi:hypothetical protein